MNPAENPATVALMPYRRPGRTDHWELGLRPELRAITGTVELGEHPSAVASRLLQDAGFSVLPGALKHLGVCGGTSADDGVYHLFAADVSHVERGEARVALTWTYLTGEKVADPLVYVMAVRAELL